MASNYLIFLQIFLVSNCVPVYLYVLICTPLSITELYHYFIKLIFQTFTNIKFLMFVGNITRAIIPPCEYKFIWNLLIMRILAWYRFKNNTRFKFRKKLHWEKTSIQKSHMDLWRSLYKICENRQKEIHM